jgi:hypothetical protein
VQAQIGSESLALTVQAAPAFQSPARAITMIQYLDGNRLSLLRSGAKYFPSLESSIDQARTEGVLEAVVVASLGARLPAPELLAAVLAYRATYYLLPLALPAYGLSEAAARRADCAA